MESVASHVAAAETREHSPGSCSPKIHLSDQVKAGSLARMAQAETQEEKAKDRKRWRDGELSPVTTKDHMEGHKQQKRTEHLAENVPLDPRATTAPMEAPKKNPSAISPATAKST
jgi:hypothetical protein